MKHNKEYLNRLMDLFITFFRIGLFTFGGGYAMIPMIERELVKRKKWISRNDIIDIFALSQTIPGAISVNASAFIGHRVAGKRGTIVALLGVILPSFVIIIVIAAFFMKFQDYPIVQKAFLGIRTGIVALILLAAIRMGKASIVDKATFLIALITVALLLFLQLHPIIIIIAGAISGVLLYNLNPKKIITPENRKDNENDLS